jgi:hypothetical protein
MAYAIFDRLERDGLGCGYESGHCKVYWSTDQKNRRRRVHGKLEEVTVKVEIKLFSILRICTLEPDSARDLKGISLV